MEGKRGSNRITDGGGGGICDKNDFIEMGREREGGWCLNSGTRSRMVEEYMNVERQLKSLL